MSPSKIIETQEESSGEGTTSVDADQLEKEIKKSEQKLLEKFNQKIDEKQERTTEILAIFITLFTFISVNITIFVRVQDLQSAAWFIILITLASTFILSFVLFALKRQQNEYSVKALVILIVLIIILLIGTFIYNPKLNEQPINTERESSGTR